MKALLGALAAGGLLAVGGMASSSAMLTQALPSIPQIASAASAAALRDICGPELQTCPLLETYQAAARTCPGLSWTVLAGVGKIETDHGRSQLPGVHSGQNFAGAMGPMQFLAATFAAFHLPGMADVYSARDAIFAAANYLCHNHAGDPGALRAAIFAYNHADWYVNEVLAKAAEYAADATSTVQAVLSGVVRAANPFGGSCRPVLTQGFGPSSLPGEPAVFGYEHFHTGFDLACPAGTPVHTVTDGVAHVTVGCVTGIFACGGGWGNNVVVETQLALPGTSVVKRFFVRYAHLVQATVRDGAAVHSGDLVGLEGTTGYSTGPHLHFELDSDAPQVAHAVNPAPLLEVS